MNALLCMRDGKMPALNANSRDLVFINVLNTINKNLNCCLSQINLAYAEHKYNWFNETHYAVHPKLWVYTNNLIVNSRKFM
jgi:hypothetical protein